MVDKRAGSDEEKTVYGSGRGNDRRLFSANETGSYRPIRRIEQPIFREVETNGETMVEPCGRIIEFEGVRDEP